MAAGWIAQGPPQPAGPANDAPVGNAPPGNTIAGDWQLVGQPEPLDPTAIKPVAKNAIEDTRSIYQQARDFVFGHDPDADDTDQVRKPGVLPSIVAGAQDLDRGTKDFATAGPDWSTLAKAYPHILAAQAERVGAGVQEATGASQTQSAELQIAALNVLPQAAARLKSQVPGQSGIVPVEQLAQDPLVEKTARGLGLDPVVFASQWSQYAGMSPEKQADAMADAQATLADGAKNKELGANSRYQAWADERAWEPSDLLNGKLDPWTLKSVAFNTATALPAVVATAGATLAGSAAGGPAGGLIAGATVGSAIFGPQGYANAKDAIDAQSSRLLEKADELDAAAPIGSRRALNPAAALLRQQAADLQASSDKIAMTAGMLTAVASAAGGAPLSAVLARAPGGQAILNRIVGSAIAQTAGGRVAGTAIANGAGAVVQASLQKAIDVGIVHEDQSLADALKDIAAAGVIGVTTALPIAGAHEMLIGGPRAQAKRDFDTEQFAAQAQRMAAGGALGGEPSAASQEDYPGYRWDPNIPNGTDRNGNAVYGRFVPTGTNGANAETTAALTGPQQPTGETNADGGEPLGGAGGGGAAGARQAYTDKMTALNTAAAKAEKRSDITLQPEEEGWSIHVNGEPVATFDTAANARAALASARKLVGTAPKVNPSSSASAATAEADTDQGQSGAPQAQTEFPQNPPSEDAAGTNAPAKPTAAAPASGDANLDDLEHTQQIDVQPETDRRQDTDLRARFDAMTPEQKFAAAYAHELTGIPNRRAYVDSPKKPAQVSIDVDSLKWVNDNMGHPSGDAYLKAVATALHQASGGNAYHISGDEFVVQADSPEHAQAIMAAAKARLADATLTFEHPDGRTITLKGIGVSHGTGQSLEEADSRLAQNKADREQSGLRAGRGSEPPGTSRGSAQAGLPAEERGPATGGGLSGGRQTEVLGQRVQAPAVPTQAQAAAGNYFKPTVEWHGLPIKIENEPGSQRSFTYPNGNPGQRTMLAHYGYFPGREGADGDGVDVYIGPAKSADSGKAYVIDQLRPEGGAFDEHKVVVGVGSAKQAKELYLKHYQEGWQGFGAITAMDHEALADWLAHGDLTQPVAWKPVIERGQGPDARYDSILEYLARHKRGLDSTEAEAQGIDPADMKLAAAHVGIRRAFRKGGMGFDQAAEHLHEEGYPVTDEHGNYSPNVLLERLADELAGIKHFSSHNQTHTEELARAEHERIVNVQAELSQRQIDRLSAEQIEARMAALEAEQERLAIQAERTAGDAEDMNSIPFSKRQRDLFGEQNHVKNEIKKLQIAKDKKRNSGQESLETGRPDDLFSQARQQMDLTDIKEPPTEYALADKASKRPISNQLDIFAPRAVTPAAAAVKKSAAILSQKTKLVTVGTFRSGHDKITTWQQAAHVLAPLRKGSQETMAVLVLDKNGKPLSVIRGGMGTINGASVEYWSLSGAVASIPGADSVYLVHNHPSGSLVQGEADNTATAKLTDLLDAMGLKTHGMIVLTPNGAKASFVPSDPNLLGHQGIPGEVAPGGKTRALVPVAERRYAAGNRQTGLPEGVIGTQLANPRGTRKVVETVAQHTPSGVLLLNNHYRVVGLLPMADAAKAALRLGSDNTGAWDLLRALHEANANNIIPYGVSEDAVKNVVRFARAAALNAPDAFVKNATGAWNSMQESGFAPAGDTFKRTKSQSGVGMPVADVKAIVDKLLGHFRNNPTDVVVVQSAADLDKIPELAGRTDPDAIGLLDPRTGKIYLVADEMHSPEHVALTLAHEYVVHYGLRAQFDDRQNAEYQAILSGVFKAMPAEVRARFEQAFPGQDFASSTLNQRLVAAEEALAYAEERYANGADISKPVQGLLERLYTLLRDWLRNKLGLAPKFDSLFVRRTLDDLRTFLKNSRNRPESQRSDEAPAAAKPQDTFYSALARAVDAAKRDKGTGPEWEATLRNMTGVKAEEMQWLGLKDWLAGRGRVTKQEVAEYVHAHRVQLGEVRYGGNDQRDVYLNEIRSHGFDVTEESGGHPRLIFPEDWEEEDPPPAVTRAYHELEDLMAGGDPPQYQEWATPGGQNYREMLFTLQSKPYGVDLRKSIFDKYEPRIRQMYDKAMDISRTDTQGDLDRAAAAREVDRLRDERNIEADRIFTVPEPYISPHWEVDNVVAHARADDRFGPHGERVYHIHEIQSDWHQAGRKHGYVSGFDLARLKAASAGDPSNRLNPNAPPDAPFKTSWPELAFKHMLREAVERGYDAISWDTGSTNAGRYNMQRVADKISVAITPNKEPPEYHVRATKGGTVVHQSSDLNEEQLAELLGKDMAQKAISRLGVANAVSTDFLGDDLKIGGAGMRAFYDGILPKKVNALVKKWGASVEAATLPSKPGGRATIEQIDGGHWRVTDRDGRHFEFDDFRDAREFLAAESKHNAAGPEGGLPVHLVRITPAMRDSVLEGLPMFKKKGKGKGGAPPAPRAPGPIRKGYEVARTVASSIPNNEFVMAFRRILAPAGVSEFSRSAALLTRENLGELAQAKTQALHDLESYAKAFDQLPIPDRYDFIDAMETGQSQPHAPLQRAADTIRGMLDDTREEVQALGVGALENWIENYFPHIWQDQKAASKVFRQIFGRRPLKGPASFLKQRTIPTTREGLEKGLQPISSNPLILAYAKIVEMKRFIAGVKLMQKFKDEGLAVFLPAHKMMPEGWAEIEDAVGRVLQWSEAEGGFVIRGKYIMPQDAARVINNHLSASALANFLPAQLFRVASNAVNALQLGFSGFHLGFTTLDAIVSKNALGIERLLHGEPVRAAATFLEANGVITGPIMNLARGYKLLKAYTNISGATPEMRQLVEALQAGGGRVSMDMSFAAARGISPFKGTGFATLAGEVKGALTLPSGRMAELGKVVGGFPREYATRLWRDLQAMVHEMQWPILTVPLEIAGRITRASTSVIMEHIVPMQKLGVFSDLASDWLRRNPQADPVAMHEAMQRIWDSVDNRLGEMVYDNVFWNRTFKDVAHMMVRAVGWNLGTVRELGGAAIDVVKLLDYMARGAPPEPAGTGLTKTAQARMDYEASKSTLTRIAEKAGHRITYTLALIATTMLLGAIATKLMSGQGPQEIKDYFFPWTGRKTKYGTKERMSMPTYTKDLYEYGTMPVQTLINKANPIFGIMHSIYANEDFYGNPIRHSDADFWTQMKEGASYAARETLPFSYQGGKQYLSARNQELGDASGDLKRQVLTIAPYAGFGPAPARITSPDQMERYQQEEEERGWVRGLQRQYKAALERHDEPEIKRLRAELAAAKHKAKQTQGAIKQDRSKAREQADKIGALIQGKSRDQAVAALKDAGLPAFAQLWNAMSDNLRPRVAERLGAYA
jgi:diguanylate cyclase (GGDEF)-like protein